jgi:sec-independent protein translocase protein TatB
MFNLSFSEILVIIVIGILVVGPEELPGLIQKIRRTLHQLKQAASHMMAQVEGQTGVDSLKEEANAINHSIQTIVDLEGKSQPAYNVQEVMDDLQQYQPSQETKAPMPEKKDPPA